MATGSTDVRTKIDFRPDTYLLYKQGGKKEVQYVTVVNRSENLTMICKVKNTCPKVYKANPVHFALKPKSSMIVRTYYYGSSKEAQARQCKDHDRFTFLFAYGPPVISTNKDAKIFLNAKLAEKTPTLDFAKKSIPVGFIGHPPPKAIPIDGDIPKKVVEKKVAPPPPKPAAPPPPGQPPKPAEPEKPAEDKGAGGVIYVLYDDNKEDMSVDGDEEAEEEDEKENPAPEG